MKLTYRDRIIIIVAAVIAILALGIFLLIKPKITDISTNKNTLKQRQDTWSEIEKEINEIPKLQENIKKLHAEAKEKTGYFTEPLTAYQIDQFLQGYADKYELEIVTAGVSVDEPMAQELEFYYYTPNVLTYALYETADLDGTLAKELEATMKEATTLSARTAQEVEKRGITFTATAEKENVIKFLNDIKALDTTILVTDVTINDYTFCPEDSVDFTDLEGRELEEAEEQIDHSDVTISLAFYSVQQPTDPYLGE